MTHQSTFSGSPSTKRCKHLKKEKARREGRAHTNLRDAISRAPHSRKPVDALQLPPQQKKVTLDSFSINIFYFLSEWGGFRNPPFPPNPEGIERGVRRTPSKVPQSDHLTEGKNQLGDPNGTTHFVRDPHMPQPTSPLETEFQYAVSPRNNEAYPADRVRLERWKEEDAHFKMVRGGAIFTF